MREFIAKLLVSHGIDNANYGISSSSSKSESDHPYWAVQLTAHTSVGKYLNSTNKVNRGLNSLWAHGGSGGAGMVTLDSTIGNQFSHEVSGVNRLSGY